MYTYDTDKYIDSFLPFDLEAIFVSSVVVLIAPLIDYSLLENPMPWLQKTDILLDDMISCGNIIARFRKSEIEQLSGLLNQLCPDNPTQHSPSMEGSHQAEISPHMSSPVATTYQVPELLATNDVLTSGDIMALAQSINMGDVDWVADAVIENEIW